MNGRMKAWNISRMPIGSLVAVVGLMLSVTGCALRGGPVEGRVFDADTKVPVAGAIVIARWTGGYMVSGHSACYHAESAVTDEEGRFRMPAWKEPSRGPYFTPNKGQLVDVFKIGYFDYMPPEVVGSDDFQLKNIRYLKLDDAKPAERFKRLERLVTASGCDDAGVSRRHLYPFYEAIYKEAKTNAASPQEKKDLQWIREVAASQAVADPRTDISSTVTDKRIEEFLKDHLQ